MGWKSDEQKSNSQSSDNQEIKWKDIKEGIKTDNLSGDALNKVESAASRYSSLVIQKNEIDEVIELFKRSRNLQIRLNLFKILKSKFFGQKAELVNLFKTTAESNDQLLAPLALSALVDSELSRDTRNRDQWETWQWSDDVKKLLEESANKNMYKLSAIGFSSLTLLRLAQKYPDSKFAKGAKEYRGFIGEEPYFGAYINLPNNKSAPELRLPFNAEKELKFWPYFIKKYPQHPATDDAMYRMARAYETQHDYQNAIIWYYKASQSPDRSLGDLAAAPRALFLIDLAATSDLLKKLLDSKPDQMLLPILEYSQAVKLIRENKVSEAIHKLEMFVVNYQNKTLKDIKSDDDSEYIKPSSRFWGNVNRQIENLKKLNRIRQKEITDERLYEEASFWFENNLTAYNYLWRGIQGSAFRRIIPREWNGNDTATERSLSYEIVKLTSKNYDAQIGYLISIKLFQRLIDQYPNSSLAKKSKYSIILNYYWLAKEDWTPSLLQKLEWKKAAIKNAHEFVDQFPKSSMADDALLTIGELGDSIEAVASLEKLFREYPNSDRKKGAKILLENAKSSLADSKRGDYVITIGVQLKEVKGGWLNLTTKTVIQGVISNSPAERAGLQAQDIILKADGTEVANLIDVKAKIRSHNPGEVVQLEIERNGSKLNLGAVTELIKE